MAKEKFAQHLVALARQRIPNIEAANNFGADTGTTWMHGNNVPQMSGIDLQRFGSVTGTPASREAFFLTNNRDDALGFAQNAAKEKGGDPSVHEMFYRLKKHRQVNAAIVPISGGFRL